MVENLFGIDYDATEKRLRIIPHVPKELFGKEIEISNLKIPSQNDLHLDMKILQKKEGKATILVKLIGNLPDGMLEIYLPIHDGKKILIKDNDGKILPSLKLTDGLKNVAGTGMKMENTIGIIFQ